jgi:hypothetical protein
MKKNKLQKKNVKQQQPIVDSEYLASLKQGLKEKYPTRFKYLMDKSKKN